MPSSIFAFVRALHPFILSLLLLAIAALPGPSPVVAALQAGRTRRGADSKEEDQRMEEARRVSNEGCRLGLLLRNFEQGVAIVRDRHRATRR